MSLHRGDIVRAVKDIRAEPDLSHAVDLAVAHLITPLRDEDGGASGIAREVSTPANPELEALIASLERLIQQWEQRISHFAFELEQTPESSAFSNGANAVMKDLKAVLSSLTMEREP